MIVLKFCKVYIVVEFFVVIFFFNFLFYFVLKDDMDFEDLEKIVEVVIVYLMFQEVLYQFFFCYCLLQILVKEFQWYVYMVVWFIRIIDGYLIFFLVVFFVCVDWRQFMVWFSQWVEFLEYWDLFCFFEFFMSCFIVCVVFERDRVRLVSRFKFELGF